MILIRDATIVDGTGAKPFVGDIAIKHDRIVSIGTKIPREHARTIIDARGAYVFPGFIDTNTESDHYFTLFTEPDQRAFLLQGVTTIMGGTCGTSLAPLFSGSLSLFQKWSSSYTPNVSWHSVRDFLHALSKQSIGVNFGTLIGYDTLRHEVIGHDKKDLTEREITRVRQMLKEGLKEGAFGLSVELGHAPGRSVPHGELIKILDTLREVNGVFAIHLRNEKEKMAEATREAVRFSQEGKVTTIINHLQPHKGHEEEFLKSVKAINFAAKRLPIYFDIAPFDTSLVPLSTLLPEELRYGTIREMLSYLEHENHIETLQKKFAHYKPNDILIIRAHHNLQDKYLTIGEFAKQRSLSVPDAIIELMKLTKLKAGLLIRDLDLDLTIQNLGNVRSLIASHTPSLGVGLPHERLSSTFKTFLSIIEKMGSLPIEVAIKKITSIPAELFGIQDRGTLAIEKKADLVIMTDGEISHVMVNGKFAVSQGVYTDTLSGEVLERTS